MSDQLLNALWYIKSGLSFNPDFVVDVGACSGTYGLYGLFDQPAPKYFVVEPLSKFNDVLQKHLKHRDYVIENCCLSDFEGQTNFRVGVAGQEDSSHIVRGSNQIGLEGGSQIVNVPVTTLDHLLSKHIEVVPIKGKRLVIKIDVQGFEPNVIKGGVRTITDNDCVLVVEVSVSCKDVLSIFSILDAVGYTLVDCIDFCKFKNRRVVTSHFDAIFMRKSV